MPNWYAECDRPLAAEASLLIGQSNPHWNFLWRGYPELGLTSKKLWRGYLNRDDVTIVNQYGEEVGLTRFLKSFTENSAVRCRHEREWFRYPMTYGGKKAGHENWLDEDGSPFTTRDFSDHSFS